MVRLPRSCRQRKITDYAKLLRRVAPHAATGFDFQGLVLKPGACFPVQALRPAPDWPRSPVLLECAGPVGSSRGHRRAPELFILWRYDPEAAVWRELARTEAQGWEWAAILAPAARAAIAEQLPMRPPAEASGVVHRIACFLEAELQTAAAGDRWKILALIHEELAGRAAQLTIEGPSAPFLAARPAALEASARSRLC